MDTLRLLEVGVGIGGNDGRLFECDVLMVSSVSPMRSRICQCVMVMAENQWCVILTD